MMRIYNSFQISLHNQLILKNSKLIIILIKDLKIKFSRIKDLYNHQFQKILLIKINVYLFLIMDKNKFINTSRTTKVLTLSNKINKMMNKRNKSWVSVMNLMTLKTLKTMNKGLMFHNLILTSQDPQLRKIPNKVLK